MLQFLQDNLSLVAIIVIALISLSMPLVDAKRFAPVIAPRRAIKFFNERKAQLIDVRQPNEFKKGHISGSKNIPADTIQGAMDALNREAPVILIDKTGGASRPVAKKLRQEGFKEVYILDTGIVGWLKEQMPLE